MKVWRIIGAVLGGLLAFFGGPWAIRTLGWEVAPSKVRAALLIITILALFGLAGRAWNAASENTKKIWNGALAAAFGLAVWGSVFFLFERKFRAAMEAHSSYWAVWLLASAALGFFAFRWAKNAPYLTRLLALGIAVFALWLIVWGGGITAEDALANGAKAVVGAPSQWFSGGAAEVYPISWADVPSPSPEQEFHVTLKASDFGGKSVDLTLYCGINEFPAGSVVSIRATGEVQTNQTVAEGQWYGPEGGTQTPRELCRKKGTPEYIGAYLSPDLAYAGLIGKTSSGPFLCGRFWAGRVVKSGRIWAGINTLSIEKWRRDNKGSFDIIVAISYGY